MRVAEKLGGVKKKAGEGKKKKGTGEKRKPRKSGGIKPATRELASVLNYQPLMGEFMLGRGCSRKKRGEAGEAWERKKRKKANQTNHRFSENAKGSNKPPILWNPRKLYDSDHQVSLVHKREHINAGNAGKRVRTGRAQRKGGKTQNALMQRATGKDRS